MAKLGIRWLEPDTHVGKTSFVKMKNVIWNQSRDMPAGTIVKARWKSTSKAYRAVLLNNLLTKSTNDHIKSTGHLKPTDLRHTTKKCPATVGDTERETSGTKQTSDGEKNLSEKDANLKVKQLEQKLVEVERKVLAISNQIEAMKKTFKGELDGLKAVFIGGQTIVLQQLQRIELSMKSKSDGPARQTQGLTEATTERKTPIMASHDSLDIPLSENGKRIQPAYGLIENGCITVYRKEHDVISIPCEHYRKIWEDSKTATSFLRKLIKRSFRDEELAESNYRGGNVVSVNGMIVKKSLDHERLSALFAQVELEFPSSTKGENFSKIRETVNEECRRNASKIRALQQSKKENGVQ